MRSAFIKSLATAVAINAALWTAASLDVYERINFTVSYEM